MCLTSKSCFPKFIANSRLFDSIDAILLMQNKDGRFGNYEQARGGAWMELLSPAEVFDRIMVEYSYCDGVEARSGRLAVGEAKMAGEAQRDP